MNRLSFVNYFNLNFVLIGYFFQTLRNLFTFLQQPTPPTLTTVSRPMKVSIKRLKLIMSFYNYAAPSSDESTDVSEVSVVVPLPPPSFSYRCAKTLWPDFSPHFYSTLI